MTEETVRIVIQGQDRLSGPAKTASAALGGLQRAAGVTKTDLAGVERASGSAARAVGGLRMSAQSGTSAFVALRGAVLPLIALFAGGMAIGTIVNAIGGAVQAASNLNETVNKVEVVFGGASDAVKAFAKNSDQALGMSENTALSAIATFGNLFTTIGVGKDVAAQYSNQLVQNAADLASFNNIDPTLVLEKLRAGLVGEAEPLRQLGIDVSETGLKIEALRQGIKKNTETMTQAEKVALRYSLVQRQMTNAAGDFARTSTGLANSQRIVQAQIQDMSANLGKAFYPAVVAIVGAFSTLLPQLLAVVQPAMESVGRWVTEAAATITYVMGNIPAMIRSVQTAFAGLPPFVQQLIPALATLVPILLGLGAAIVSIMAVWPLFAAGFAVLLGPVGAVILAVSALYVAFATNLFGIRDLAMSAMPAIGDAIATGLGTAIDAVDAILQQLAPMVAQALSTIEAFWIQHGQAILDIAATVWALVQENVNTAILNVRDIISVVLDVINGNWGAAWSTFLEIVNRTWTAIVDNVVVAGNAIIKAVQVIAGAISGLLMGVHNLLGGLPGGDVLNLGFVSGEIDKLAKSNVTLDGIGVSLKGITAGFAGAGTSLRRFNDDLGTATTSGKAKVLAFAQSLRQWVTRPNLPTGGPDEPRFGENRPAPPLPPVPTLPGGAGGAGGGAKEAAAAVKELIAALVALHPATLAAAAAIKFWDNAIASVNMAITANADQLKAAQAELGRMQDRLQDLGRQLDIAKRKLVEFSQPRLTGMGAAEKQIAAVQEQMKRITLAKSLGVPLSQIIARFPRLTGGMEQYLATLPQTEGGLSKVLEQLQLMQSLSFDEKMRLLGEAAKDSVGEMDYGTAMAGTLAYKAQVDSLTVAIASQEAAIRAQEQAIKSIQAEGEALNATLANYQAQLAQAKANQDAVTGGLTLAYEWFLKDRQAMIALGGEALLQVPIIDAQMRALMLGMDAFALGEAAAVQGGIVTLYETSAAKLTEINALVQSLNTTVTTTHVIRTVYEGGSPEGRALGGPVYAGIPYTVGETGKETFMPETNGRIIPHTLTPPRGGDAAMAGGIDYDLLARAMAKQPMVVEMDGERVAIVVRDRLYARGAGRMGR